MKKVLTSVFGILLAGIVYSQADNTDIDMIQGMFGKSKRLIVSEHIQPDAKSNDAFWKIYDDYEDKRKKIEKERFLLIKEYADKYETLDGAQADKLVTSFMKNTREINRLHKIYFRKAEKAVGGLKAATFIQLEIFFQTAVQSNIQSQIPVIGDLQKRDGNDTRVQTENN